MITVILKQKIYSVKNMLLISFSSTTPLHLLNNNSKKKSLIHNQTTKFFGRASATATAMATATTATIAKEEIHK